MIEYGLNKEQSEQLERFSHIFSKNIDQFVLNSILVILDLWKKDKGQWMEIDPDSSEINFTIDLPPLVEAELDHLSDEYDLSISETINGVVGLILDYLNFSWSDQSGLESDNMSDDDKVDQITRDNLDSGGIWSELFP